MLSEFTTLTFNLYNKKNVSGIIYQFLFVVMFPVSCCDDHYETLSIYLNPTLISELIYWNEMHDKIDIFHF